MFREPYGLPSGRRHPMRTVAQRVPGRADGVSGRGDGVSSGNHYMRWRSAYHLCGHLYRVPNGTDSVPTDNRLSDLNYDLPW